MLLFSPVRLSCLENETFQGVEIDTRIDEESRRLYAVLYMRKCTHFSASLHRN